MSTEVGNFRKVFTKKKRFVHSLHRLCILLFTISAVHFACSSGQQSCEFGRWGKQYELRVSRDAEDRYDTNLPFDLWSFLTLRTVKSVAPRSRSVEVDGRAFFVSQVTKTYYIVINPATDAEYFMNARQERKQQLSAADSFCRLLFLILSDMSSYLSNCERSLSAFKKRSIEKEPAGFWCIIRWAKASKRL